MIFHGKHHPMTISEKVTVLEIFNRLQYFFPGIHDKRTSPRNGFFQWQGSRQQKSTSFICRGLYLIARLQEIGRLPKDITPLHFAYARIGAIDVFFHQAEKCRRVTGVDPADPDVVDSHSRAAEFMFLGPPPASDPDP